MRKELLYFLFITGFQLNVFAQDSSIIGKGLYASDFMIDGIPRNITFYIPANYGDKGNYPLAIFLHGTNESGKNAIKVYGDILHTKADSSGCIIIYPDAVAGHWNDFISDSLPSPGSVNDVGFITIMIDYFVQQYHCDPQRVYATGFAGGGEMAYRLGCNIPNKIAAIAAFMNPKSATVNKCTITDSVSLMDTNKLSAQPGKKADINAVNEAWIFFMEHVKK